MEPSFMCHPISYPKFPCLKKFFDRNPTEIMYTTASSEAIRIIINWLSGYRIEGLDAYRLSMVKQTAELFELDDPLLIIYLEVPEEDRQEENYVNGSESVESTYLLCT